MWSAQRNTLLIGAAAAACSGLLLGGALRAPSAPEQADGPQQLDFSAVNGTSEWMVAAADSVQPPPQPPPAIFAQADAADRDTASLPDTQASTTDAADDDDDVAPAGVTVERVSTDAAENNVVPTEPTTLRPTPDQAGADQIGAPITPPPEQAGPGPRLLPTP